MFKRLIFCFVLVFTSICFSQQFSVSAIVNDRNNEPIAYTNVVIVNRENPDDVSGTTTNEDGVFKIEDLNKGDYVLEVSALGFENYSIKLNLIGNVDLKIITLNESLEELEGVTVIAKRPTVKRLVDRLVFNVENSTLSNNNILDVLKHTPGVLVNNESITIKQSTPTIYINDRKVHLSSSEIQQLLEGTSASNIKSIEVITNPPAKYEAEGGAVLNIITSKNIIAGYSGSVFGNYKQGSEFPKYAFGTSHFFKGKKLNTYLNYSISPRKDFRNNDEFVNFIDNNQVTSSWETDFKRTRETSNQNINANIDYELDKRNSLGFSTSMLIAPRANTQTNSNSITDVFSNSKVLDSTFITDNRKVDETFNIAFTLDYMHKFKKEGEKLLISAHHTNYDFSSFQNVDTRYLFSDESLIRNNQFQTFSSQEIKLYTGQLDYELPINDSSVFEAGAKISNINSKSILRQDNFENGEKEEDLQNSDTFLYDETNYAAYLSYSKDWDSWSLKLGLRTELTGIKGNSLSNNNINNTKYSKFFPSLFVSHSLNEENEVYFNYSKRIYRPRYKQLNPFKYFLNDNTFITGDPNLLPRIDNQFILGYTFNKDYTFELYYRHEDNPALQYFYQDNDKNILVYQYTNLDESISYGLDFTTYVALNDFWNLYVLSSIFYYKNNFTPIGSSIVSFEGEQWSLYSEIINYFTFLKDKSLVADVSFNYLSPTNDGPSNTSFISSLDVSIRKTLWKNRASFNLGVLDVFNTQNFNTTTRYLNQDIFSKFQFENRMLVFGFNYKFGNFKLKNNKKEIDLVERNRLKSN
ncbi:outer membrane beta-barrel family protein [uncultured Algibacter sp.]|uniref:outer membrane beta-barrel family protein n=1 Tax=uncultured Algibacter sp. TaxID=298659 RepID=UPI002610EB77|nr:outer membrane beta-barrel family protein [uncultured Algibacter sp.]